MNRFKCQMTSDAKNQSTIRLDLNIYDLECLCLAPLQTNIEWTLVMIFQFYSMHSGFLSYVRTYCSGFDLTNTMARNRDINYRQEFRRAPFSQPSAHVLIGIAGTGGSRFLCLSMPSHQSSLPNNCLLHVLR